MRMRPFALALTLLLLAAGPTRAQTNDEQTAAAFAKQIEQAHGHTAWQKRHAVAANITLDFGGNRLLDGADMRFNTAVGKARLEPDAQTTVVFDGETAWLTPADSDFSRPRFHVLTWSYFMAAPFKLRDPGANLEMLGERDLRGETYNAARLTFDPGVGDSPDDWYIVYRDKDTNRLHAMAYIVTYGKSREKAEQEPHAIVYENFADIDGVTLAKNWRFHHWSVDRGVYGEPIGKVRLENIRFIDPAEDTFTKPDGAREVTRPESH